MPQQSLRESIADMEKAGLIARITEEKRVDETEQPKPALRSAFIL
jgi:hypothetical protein